MEHIQKPRGALTRETIANSLGVQGAKLFGELHQLGVNVIGAVDDPWLAKWQGLACKMAIGNKWESTLCSQHANKSS